MDIKYFQKRVAKIALGNAALRNQGARGVVNIARKFIESIDLKDFGVLDENGFKEWIDNKTKELKEKLPEAARNWGTARKALNVFFLQVCLDKEMNEKYGLSKVLPFLEVPLDSYVYKELKNKNKSGSKEGNLPQWKGIKKLSPEDSQRFQEFAESVAKKEGIPRVYLDLLYWI